MDKLASFRIIISGILQPFAAREYANGEITNEIVIDTVNDHYLVLSVGWQKKTRRIHGCLIHIDIIDGKIWIQRDGTEDGIAYLLEESGVSKSDIVIAFHSESVRPHTGYAIK
jgi:hypothetical protein